MEPTSLPPRSEADGRVGRALGSRTNWEQLGKFCVVGAAGYAVNLVVYTLLLHEAGLHYIAAAIGSFLVAVSNNYLLNRLWTFRRQRGGVGRQGLRFLVVSTGLARREPRGAPPSRPGRRSARSRPRRSRSCS